MRMRTWLALTMLVSIAACSPSGQAPETAVPAPSTDVAPPDMHTSQNSLDWAGTYEGVLDCADCAGILASLVLAPDGGYTWTARRLAKGEIGTVHQGNIAWSADGGSIALAPEANAPGFQVGEGRLLALAADDSGSSADAPCPSLQKVAQPVAAAQALESHAWTLAGATGADNARIDALFPEGGRLVTLTFAGGRFQAAGGCNGLRAGYQLTPEGQFTASAGAATMMACEPPLMAVDATLAGLFAAPLELALTQGPSPALALMAATGEVLLFRGELTPEARYGPASTKFLEVGPQRVACAEATSADGLCLQVREISFDAQGLRVGEPGAFAPFAGGIEGYAHVAGTRNVLRIKHFESDATPPGGVKVLDLVVESEVVPQ